MRNTKTPKNSKNIIIVSTLAATLVAGGAAYWAADEYLIPKVEVANASNLVADNSAVAATQDSTESNAEQAGVTVTTHVTADGGTTSKNIYC